MRSAARVLVLCLILGPALSRAASAPQSAPVLLQVPFYPDDTDQCGPSSLASVLGYWGKPADTAELRREIYRARLKGALTVDLFLAAERHGLTAEMVNATLAQIKNELDAGRPVIAFVNVGFRFYPIGHYLVVTGYDEEKRSFFVHSGKRRNRLMSFRTFDRQWEKMKRWALFILPPQR